jgi:cytochrome c oxidase assembly factor CtaG
VSPDVSWSVSFGPLILIGALTAAYVLRWNRVGAAWARLALFLGGIAALAIALLSPVDGLGEQLFFMHMVQHVLLLDVAPVLLLLGLTKVILRPVTRRVLTIERRAGVLLHPITAVVLYVGTMWVWHVPALYDAAAANAFVHVLEHLSFAVAGGLYWWHVFSPIRPRHRMAGLGPAGYMLSTKVGVGLLGVALTFAQEPLYAFYADQPDWWGLAPQTDQAIGGAIMALEQGVVMGIALAFLFVRMLGESEREEQRAERYAA